MKFQLEIALGDEAMREDEDVAYALEDVARILKALDMRQISPRVIYDANGNAVGKWEVVE